MSAASQMPGQPAEFAALNALAMREHRAGRLAAAAAAYCQILALWPDIAEIHNNLGVVLKNQGQLDQAAARYRQAIALRPDFVEAQNNLGNTLRDQGQLDEAVARFEQAIALRPEYAEAHNNLGITLCRQGQLDPAIERYRQAIALKPSLADAHNNLANALKEQGQLDDARAHYDQAIALRPDYAEAHNNLGSLLLADGKLDEAVAHYEQALAIRPTYVDALFNLASALRQQGQLDQAVARFEQALALRPDYVEAINNLGITLNQQGKFDQALVCYERALALRPDYADAHYNFGNALKQQGRLDEALARFEQALALRPSFAEALKNIAITLREQLKLATARQAFERLESLQPASADAQLGLATCYLIEEDYQRGWPGYEARLRMPELARHCSLPRWSGEPLAERSLLLLAEQGLGDTLQFLRYARLFKQRGAKVVLAAPAALGRLLAHHPEVDELFLLGSAAELPICDFYLPLLSAPLALATDAATIPCQVPYIAAETELSEKWRQEITAIDGFKIAIAWQGSRDFSGDRFRSIPLAHFAPLARLPGARLVSLQKGIGTEQIATVDFSLLDLSDRLDAAAGPFMDTAAVIQNVDLVVTSDTAIAHLAGALGAPVWVALQHSPNWRWLLDRDDSPWYPTMRLFRQTTFNQWSGVFQRIAAAVQTRRSETGGSLSMAAASRPQSQDENV